MTPEQEGVGEASLSPEAHIVVLERELARMMRGVALCPECEGSE